MKLPDNIKHVLATFSQRFGAMAIVAVASSAITYYVCQQESANTIAELRDKIADLEKMAFKSTVMQRESEQMEEIAFQQKSLSDKQREEAVKQSHIADMERNHAQLEQGLARKAEYRAVRSARQADSMRVVAEGQTALATKNMMEAERARAEADTLFYLSMANSLAQSSLAMGTTSSDLSRLLSYAAWTYNKEYGGESSQVNIYKSLLYSSESVHKVTTQLNGSVRDVDMVNIGGSNWMVGLTDYGELFYCNEADNLRAYRVGDYAFRDMVRVGTNKIIALSSDGAVVEFNADGEQPMVIRQTALGQGVWKHICKLNDGTLAVMSGDKVMWLDGSTLETKSQTRLHVGMLTMGYESATNTLHLFGQNKVHYVSVKEGEAVEMDLTSITDNVTAYAYDTRYNTHVLGTETGRIYIVDNNGKIINTLSGHSGSISALSAQKDAIVSTSYDKTMRFWSLDSRYTFAESMEFPIGKWPLSFVVDEKSQNIWLGCDGGGLSRFCISAERNAASTQSLLSREFTQNEWDFYLGRNVPYRTFMKGGSR